MRKTKVMTIFGTRPEATKMAPVIMKLKQCEFIETTVCVTAQHRQMLDQVLSLFALKPDIDLNIMKHGQTITDITTSVLQGLEETIDIIKPDIILVHGDTTTTFASALAAFYKKVKVGHVEAGLRTYDKFQPYPEEMNRLLTTSLADLHFAPTRLSKENLIKENINPDKIFITGNTAVDCLSHTVLKDYVFNEQKLNRIDFKCKRIIAMTAHRRENLGKPLENICEAVKYIVENNSDVELVYAVHQNPLVQNVANKILSSTDRVHLVDPLDMNDMHNLINMSYLVMTDSGGIQEEAPSLNKPVLVLRNVTERPEGLEAGTLKLCGTDTDEIIKTVNLLLNDKDEYNKMANAKNPFGDGNAAQRIVDGVLYSFGHINERPKDLD